MIRTIFFILASLLVLTGSIGQADEIPTTPPVPPKGEATPTPETPPAEPSQPPLAEVKPEQASPPEAPPTEAPAPPAEPGQSPPEAEPKTEKAAEKAIEQPEEEKKKPVSTEIERRGVLLGKGRLQLEITQMYAHFSSNQLFINGFGLLPILTIGEVNVQRVRRDIFITTLAGKYKITPNLQVGLSVPFQYAFSRIAEAASTDALQVIGRSAANPTVEKTGQAGGLGDVTGSLTYQLLKERLRRPTLAVGLGFKVRTGRDLFETDDPSLNLPTGSGYNSVRASLSVVKTADPAVIFGALSYTYAIPREDVVFRDSLTGVTSLIDYSPGDNMSLGMGLAYAINSKLSLGFQYQQGVTLSTRTNGRKIGGSFANAVALRIGVVWAISEKTSVDLSISPGITPDAPDVRVEMRLPWRF